MAGRETRRSRERREADWKIKSGVDLRRPLSADEVVRYFDEIDRKSMTRFGVRSLVLLELNGLHDPPALDGDGTARDPTMTLIAYAAWRHRDTVVRSLLRGGADPTIRHPGPGAVLSANDSARVRQVLGEVRPCAAVYVVTQVVRLRFWQARLRARPGAGPPSACQLCGSAEYVLPMEPCGHASCERCVWRRVCVAVKETGALDCPVCLGPLRSHTHHACPGAHEPDLSSPDLDAWLCGACSSDNLLRRTNCQTCGNCRTCGSVREDGSRLTPGDGGSDAPRSVVISGARAGGLDASGWAGPRARLLTLRASGAAGVAAIAAVAACTLVLGVRAGRSAAVRGALAAIGATALAAAAARLPLLAREPAGAADARVEPVVVMTHLSPAEDEAAFELRVLSSRTMGDKLTFVVGALIANAELGSRTVETAVGARARSWAPGVAGLQLQLVLDGDVLVIDRSSAAKATLPAGGVLPRSRKATRMSASQAARLLGAEGAIVRAVGVLTAKQQTRGARGGPAVADAGADDGPQPPAQRSARQRLPASEAAAELVVRLIVVRERGGAPPQPDWLEARRREVEARASAAREAAGVNGADPAQPPPTLQHRNPKVRFRAASPADAALELARRLDDGARRDELRAAVVAGDAVRLNALALVGYPVGSARDKYGNPGLLSAAQYGHKHVALRLVGQWGADVHARGACGATAATVAAACGNLDMLCVLVEQCGASLDMAGSQQLTPRELCARRDAPVPAAAAAGEAEACTVDELEGTALPEALSLVTLPTGAPPRLSRLVPLGAEGHAGCGSCALDNAFAPEFLNAVEALFGRLALEPRCHDSAGLNDRAYVCDVEGWLAAGLAAAVGRFGGAARVQGVAMAQMRFLLYQEVGGGLPPHVDLARTDELGRRSTHTFIFYLTGCASGGETQLLAEHSRPDAAVVASVTPVRGRLLLFPHMCPHLARPVTAEGLPKLLLRGEMF
jgi:hypothetical protein